jgi:5'-3' exonuclease
MPAGARSLAAMPRPLLTFDAPSLLYRAFFALPDSITDGDGHAVNALLGATNLVLLAVAEHRPRALVACFGQEAAHYRVELHSGYHADRPPMPPELEWQWERTREFWEAFGWTVAHSDTLEADDLLGAYSLAEAAAGGTALVMTGDRDMYQCASEDVTVLYVKTGTRGFETVDPGEVVKRYGIPPEAVPDFIALRGDPSDGIPGAPGIGEKTAADLLRRHGSLGAAILAADGEKPRVATSLRENADVLAAYKEMATLQPVDVELPPDAETDWEGASAAARSLGMNRLAERLAKGPEEPE